MQDLTLSYDVVCIGRIGIDIIDALGYLRGVVVRK